jgi:hypothetical protein
VAKEILAATIAGAAAAGGAFLMLALAFTVLASWI